MAKAVLVLTGDKALNRKLKRLAGKDAKAVVRKAARPALKPVMQEARNNVPVKTGALKKSIKVRALPRSRRSIGARVTSGTGKSDFQGKQFYGGFIEFGVKKKGGSLLSRVGRAFGAGRYRIKPVRYMKRAANKKRKHSLRIYGEKIGMGIKSLAQKG